MANEKRTAVVNEKFDRLLRLARNDAIVCRWMDLPGVDWGDLVEELVAERERLLQAVSDSKSEQVIAFKCNDCRRKFVNAKEDRRE